MIVILALNILSHINMHTEHSFAFNIYRKILRI